MEKRHIYIVGILALFIALIGTQVSFAQGTDSNNNSTDSKEYDELLDLFTSSNSRSSTSTNCTDDSFEPNNTVGNETPVSATTVNGQTYSNLKLCGQDDIDAYKLTVPANHQVKFDVLFLNAVSNIDFVVLDPSSNVIGGGATGTDNEADIVTNTSLQPAEWIVLVFNEGSGNVTYDLVLTLNPPCTDDPFEDNDSLSNPTLLTIPSTNPNLMLCDTEADVFSVSVPAGALIRVEIIFADVTPNNLELLIYDGADNFLDASSSTTSNEHRLIQNNSSVAATYKIVVVNANFNLVDTPYNLRIYNEPACVDDSFEENDSASSAATLAFPSNNPSLMFCNQDIDNYLVTVPAGTDVIIDLEFEDATSDLDLHVYENITGFPFVGSSFTVTDNEQVTFQNTSSSAVTYLISIDTFDTHLAYNPYSLNIREGTISKVYLPIILK